ncbi:hypothetical protein [Providencia alcalifaciens]|uniref:hypothetical protein n=1 Tax=Providencia alcalifaciens TaxID=126385 RepID=UPI0032DBC978
MNKLITTSVAILFLSGCTELKEGSAIDMYHDDQRQVTCYVYKSGYAGGISCIPDDQLPNYSK